MTVAIRKGHFELAQWLKETMGVTIADEMTEWAEAAAAKGYLDVLKDLFTERDADGGLRFVLEVILWKVVQAATNFGHLEVLKWILDDPVCYNTLVEQSHRDYQGNQLERICFYVALLREHIATVTWIVQHYPEMCKADTVDVAAAQNGHLDILRLVHTSLIARHDSAYAIKCAAGCGHLNFLQYLVAGEYPVGKAMENAALGGFLDIVRWIHENTPGT